MGLQHFANDVLWIVQFLPKKSPKVFFGIPKKKPHVDSTWVNTTVIRNPINCFYLVHAPSNQIQEGRSTGKALQGVTCLTSEDRKTKSQASEIDQNILLKTVCLTSTLN